MLSAFHSESVSASGLYASTAYLLVKVFPVILSHQSEQREEGPAERVKAGVIVVWVESNFEASVPLWALPTTNKQPVKLRKCHPSPHS